MTDVVDGLRILALLMAAAGGFALLQALIHRTLVGAIIVLVASAIDTMYPILPSLAFGGTKALTWDLVGILLLAAAVARLLRVASVTRIQWLLIGFGLIALLSYGRGALLFGPQQALVEFRKYFYFVAIALYFSTVDPKRGVLDQIAYAWILFAAFLLALAAARWAPLPAGFAPDALHVPDLGFRVIGAAPTLAIFQGFAIGALAWVGGQAPRWLRQLTPAFLAAVFLLQHRTVWGVAMLTLLTMLFLVQGLRRKILPILVLGVACVAGLSLTVLDTALEDERSNLTEELAASASDRATLEWRIEGWRALIVAAGPREPADIVAGLPFGGGWDRYIAGNLVRVSPHNFYVETYLRMGIAGLALVLALYWSLLRRLAGDGTGPGMLAPRALFLLLLSHPIFFISYSPERAQSVILGLGMALAALTGRAQDTEQPIDSRRLPAVVPSTGRP